jgi:hypothetical protein
MSSVTALDRRDLMPSSGLPLAHFAGAHFSLMVASIVLVWQPDLPGAFVLHPRMVALVHLLTLGWITGSIVGAFYIVGPLALGIPLRATPVDWLACLSYWIGVAATVAAFWRGDYLSIAHAAALVAAALGWVVYRVCRRLLSAPIPGGVALHVGLAFANLTAAVALGVSIGVARASGWSLGSPLSLAYAHLHLAVVGWALMLAVGLAYRLIPMILPARMPEGRRLAFSAALVEVGVLGLVAGWLADVELLLPLGAVLIVAGLAAFANLIRETVRHRLPRPPALPARDWSTWQAHSAMLWLMLAVVTGLTLSLLPVGRLAVRLQWVYGAAGMLGFLAQFIVGMQGRLVPLYAWYRAMTARGGRPPTRSAHALPDPRFACAIFLVWSAALPVLIAGLASPHETLIRIGAALLAVAVGVGWTYIVRMVRAAAMP